MATNGNLPIETEGALAIWVSCAFPHSTLQLIVLLQINSFPLTDRVQSLAETNDGQAFWEMLRRYITLQDT